MMVVSECCKRVSYGTLHSRTLHSRRALSRSQPPLLDQILCIPQPELLSLTREEMRIRSNVYMFIVSVVFNFHQ